MFNMLKVCSSLVVRLQGLHEYCNCRGRLEEAPT